MPLLHPPLRTWCSPLDPSLRCAPALQHVPLASGPLQVLQWAEGGRAFGDPIPEPNTELRSYVTDPGLCKDMCSGCGVCTREHHGCLYASPPPSATRTVPYRVILYWDVMYWVVLYFTVLYPLYLEWGGY